MPETKRMNLEILEVKERQPVGDRGAIKLAFKAKSDDGEHWYYTFRSSLFEAIEGGQGKTFEADVEIKETEQWGTQRDVKQIYVEGQPVAGKKQGGWQARQDSPETRASIEAQKRADIIMQGWIAGKLKDDDPLVVQMKGWLSTTEPQKGAEKVKLEPKPQAQKSAQKVTEPAKVSKAEQADRDSEELFPEEGSKGLSAEAQAEPPAPGAIDINILKDQLKELHWSESTFKTWLVSIGRKQQWGEIAISGTLTEVMGKLSPEQREFICKEIQERLDLK